MSKTVVLFGDRVGKQGELRLGSSAVIMDQDRKKVLLTQRSDNEQWCLPGGRVEPGETVAEGCEREVWEETGLRVKITRMIGIYSDPNKLIVYPDGNKAHIIAICFEAQITQGTPAISNETLAWGYFTQDEIRNMEMLAGHEERIADAFQEIGAVIK